MTGSPPRDPRCPSCGRPTAVPRLLGLPTSEAADAAERSEVVLGGCVVTSGAGEHWDDAACTHCHHTWSVEHRAPWPRRAAYVLEDLTSGPDVVSAARQGTPAPRVHVRGYQDDAVIHLVRDDDALVLDESVLNEPDGCAEPLAAGDVVLALGPVWTGGDDAVADAETVLWRPSWVLHRDAEGVRRARVWSLARAGDPGEYLRRDQQRALAVSDAVAEAALTGRSLDSAVVTVLWHAFGLPARPR